MSDVVERVVRDLIRNNQLSRARAVLSLFQDEYPHLLLELEASCGNWKMVSKIYEKLTDQRKEEYKTLYKTATERVKTDYTEDVKEAFEEISKNNFEGGMAILEGVSKAYPELAEAIALKLELARRKRDKARAKIYEEALKKIDASHPLLISKPEEAPKFAGLDMILLIAIIATLVVALTGVFLNFSQSNRISGMKTEIAELKDRIQNLDTSVADVKNVLSNLEKLSIVEQKIDQTSQEFSTSFEKVLQMIESVKISDSQELRALKDEITKLLLTNTSTSRSTLTLSKNLNLELTKSLWLFGYRLYKAQYYQDAYNVLNNVVSILKDTDLYFKDDAFYYMTLSLYESGDVTTAKKLFEEFTKNYPNSEYVPHAKYFLQK
ncbi:tetratricopeptide repeat protein [Thermotoga profunda]|uniref:tetratricopeptide repeat protein n=1 Tax=Thermotoga profunda TaxID=1508420 RepID=UPI0005976C2A|nr:tetratricopeptide repeat protein [Thermotoga profunda]